MIVHLLLTGNELMTGDIVDSNSAMIAHRFEAEGWTIRKKLTVADDLGELVAALRWLAADADVLIVNGGLGPTVDDLTAQALAEAAGVELREQAQALAHLQEWCSRIGIPLNAANRKQALLPAGCELIANPIGSAVGFALPIGNCRVLCTPGVPRELEPMLDESIVPSLRGSFGQGDTRVRRFVLFGLGESTLQQQISETIPAWPATVELGFRAGFPQLDLKLTTRDAAAHAQADQLAQQLQPLIADFLLGEGKVSLAEHLVQLLRARGKRLALAESCTGGLIASSLTQVPGASQVFDAGFVTYSNAIKQAVLGVDEAVLAAEGAVSAQVVAQMAAGAIARSGADYAIAVSGIAGPDGGSEDKPVGTVWIAWGSANDLKTQRLQVRFSRQQFQHYVCWIGLDLIRRELLGIDAPPPYFRSRK